MESVLIIILNWNGKDYLEACLSSIGESTEYEVYDILVVDNGSDDGSKEMVKEEFSDIDLIENNRNLGFSIGNNIGICENPGYDYYLLL
ncbi:MAG: glycosyltransferase, partial [Candidatus Nanohaloarchaea archaeon]